MEEVGGAAAIAGPKAWHRAEALKSKGVGYSAFQVFVGEGPYDFGDSALLQEVVDVPAEFLVASKVAVDPGREAIQG